MPNLLIEIGVEELPEAALNIIYSELGRRAVEIFKRERLAPAKLRVEATPRRVALFAEGLPARQPDAVEESAGPSVEKAYDPAGNPTPALQGFLKSKGVSLKESQVKETAKGKYIFVQKKLSGKPAQAVLPAALDEILKGLSFPKTMRWEKEGFRFPRPIRWVAALLDKKVLTWKFAGLKAGNKSSGHRFLSPKSFLIPGADWDLYHKALRKAHVVLSLEERKKQIEQVLGTRYHQKSFDKELVHTAANLVEEPYLLEGSFSKEYLALPTEVLASCMKKNQKIFACYDPRGKLISRFVAVLNGKRKSLSGIKAGYENVLDSRLKDARYFFEADTRESLEKKLPLLEQVTYLGKLGTMLDKTKRLEMLAENFTDMIGRRDLREDLKRAARLSKIDLMTRLVYEFPDLQGIVGGEYALVSGDKEPVAKAIATQYLPKSLSENYQDLSGQMVPLGAMFGILDRMDLLAGAFGTGLEPSGSQDHFALRRAGGGLVKIVRAFRFHFSLSEMIQTCGLLHSRVLTMPLMEAEKKLKKFFEERISFELQVKAGTRPYEILMAVFRSSSDDLADVYERFETLTAFYERDPEVFIKAAKVVERTGNMIKGVKPSGEFHEELLSEVSEKKLLKILKDYSPEIQEFLKKKDYERATSRFGEIFYGPVHDFFEQVMVNIEDTAIRQARQILVSRVNRLYTERLADLSLLSRLDQG